MIGSRSLLGTAAAAAMLLAAGCGFDSASRPPLTALTEIPAPAAPGSGEPSLAVGPEGRVYLSWLEPAGEGRHALRLAVREEAGWSAPVTIASGDDFFVNWADFPAVFALRDGSLAAHWLVRSGKGARYDIHMARSSDGGATWTPAMVPHRDGTASEHGFVSYFPAAGSQVAAVWLDGRKYAETGAGDHDLHGEMTLRTTTVGPEMALGPEVLLDERTCDCCQTASALTDEGPIVVYRDRSAGEVRDIAITRLSGGMWTEPVPVHEDGWVIAACPVNGPALSVSARRVAVAWFTAARDTPRVRLAFSEDAGATFAAPVRVDDGDPIGRVAVELLPDGGALVGWLERVGEGAELRVRRIEKSGALGPTFTVAASSAERASGFPRMARSGDAIVFAWTEPGDPARVRTATAKLPRS